MDDKIKKEITKLIQSIFSVVSAKVNRFGDPYDMYVGIKKAGSNESIFLEKYKITNFPVNVTTDVGDMTLSLQSSQLYRLNEAISYAYQISGFHQRDTLSDDMRNNINKKFIELFSSRR